MHLSHGVCQLHMIKTRDSEEKHCHGYPAGKASLAYPKQPPAARR